MHSIDQPADIGSADLPEAAEDGPRPASAAQLRFYLLDQQGGRATVVHHLTAEGPVDRDRFLRAVRTVVAEHPALRTSLHPGPEGLAQRTHPPADIDVQVLSPEPGEVEGVLARQTALVAEPFTHATGPLCRIRVVHAPGRTHCLLGVHHAVFDDESAGILLRSLARAYAEPASSTGTARRVQDLADDPGRTALLRTFWTTTLDGRSADTTLPHFAPPPPPVDDGAERFGVTTLELGDELCGAVRDTAMGSGATPFALVLAAVATVTGWYGSSRDVVLATVTGTRSGTGPAAIGCHQNTLPVRIALTGHDTASLLDHTMDALFDAVEHADLPIEEILRVTGAERRPGRTALTEVLCAQTAHQPPHDEGGLRWRLATRQGADPAHPLSVTLHHRADGSMVLELGHDATRMPAPQARLFGAHLLGALGALTESAPLPLDQLRLLTPEETAAAAGPAATTAPHPPVHIALADHARRTPDATAVRTGSDALGYAELDERVAGLGAALIAAGVRPGDRVGISLPRTPELVVAMLAVWKAGAAYVPLDPDYPHERLRYMVRDADLTAIVGTRELEPGLPLLAPSARASAPRSWPVTDPSAPAYLIYTSGTTGRPKGVVIRHENLTALLAAMEHETHGVPDVVMAGTSVSFDISGLEIHWPLARGRTLFLTDHRSVAVEPVPAGALYQCTPSVARILTGTPAGRALLERLGVLLVGGEPLPADLAAELCDLVPGPVLNCYGPTETTIWSTAWRVVPGQPVHIGSPLAGEECQVVDDDGRRLPAGCPGRLFISGAGVGDGYWRRPELTAERFVAQDGSAGPAYDTGDLAVLTLTDGLRCLGRADAQVKVLGQRIELEEVETALRRHPRVSDAVATATADATAVAVCVVLRDPSPGDSVAAATEELAEELGSFARTWLTGAMVPAVWLVAPRLPQLPNGKRDRAAVAQWAARGATVPAPAGPVPAGAAHEQVREAWERVLSRPVTDLDAGFFELGGSSADLVRLLAVLNTRYPSLRVADLFRHTTVRALASHLDDVSRAAAHSPAVARAADDRSRGADRARALRSWNRRPDRSR
ncbi:amino acid adenylation domain-containing protein [Streptomyces sp. NPDC001941]|uniref:non-ribosomal peptide synthetase n=1 Tax=Streptomyces sp. NPDC001941 TaxID=3154659 RepID=UPI003317730D